MTALRAADEPAARGLRILIADEDERALEGLAAVLSGLGHEIAPYAVTVAEAAERIAAEDPDIAIVMVHRDEHHALALIGETVEFASGPVIAQGAGGDADFVSRAAERGIAAYVSTVEPDALQAAIEIALRRHREAAMLSEKVGQLEGAMERRAAIELAKGMLMERHGIDERAAFDLLRDHARSRSRRVVDVARAVADGLQLAPNP